MPTPTAPASIEVVLNALPAMVGYWDRDLRNVFANDAYVEFFGRTPKEMRGIHIRELLGPKLYEQNRPFIEGALSGERQLFERAITTPSGEVRYTQASYIPDIADGDVRGFVVLVTDITERRRIEEEVERSRALLAEAEQVARMGSWEWDLASNEIVWSDGLYAIYGIGREDIELRYEQGGSKYVHPEDRDRVDATIRHALDTGMPIDLEYRIIRPDGRVRRLHSRAEVIADAEGRPLRVTGTAQDVTEVRATAEALQETATTLGRRAAALQRLAGPNGAGFEELTRHLTPRQLEILDLIGQGLSNAEISRRLYIGESTVKWHVRKILRALGVGNRASAIAKYLAVRPR